MQHPYIRLLRVAGAPRLLLATFAGALPIGMLSLGVLLLVQQSTGSLGAAGAVAGALTAGNAFGVALQGRLIDRWGQPPVLLSTATVCALALGLLVLFASWSVPPFAEAGTAALAGAAIPATTSSMRVLWPSLVREQRLRTSAYALLALMFTLALILGPLIVSGLIVLLSPALAVIAAAILAIGAAALFATTTASRHWRPASLNPGWKPRALNTAGSRTLIAASLLSGFASGLGSVAVPAVAILNHQAAAAGVLLSLAAIGDGVIGLAYGARSWQMSAPWRLSLLQGCAALIGASKAVARSPVELAPLMVLGGAVAAPAGITATALLDVVAPEGALTEAYTVMVGTSLGGNAIGSAIGGQMAHTAGPSLAFALAALATAAVAVWTVARRRTLDPRSQS